MKLRMLRGFPEFRCAASDCPDTCCRDWAVVLDEDAARDYRTLSGPLGEELRGVMGEVDGEPCLVLQGGVCPMLDARGLCRVQLELGESRLCENCRLHPRFAEEYGILREWCLSLACPEAVRLLLSDPSPLTFSEETTPEAVSGYNDLNPKLFYALLSARKTGFSIVQDRSVSRRLRLGKLLAFGEALQKKLDGHRITQLDDVTERYRAGRCPEIKSGGAADGSRALLRRLRDLPPIQDGWTALLEETLAHAPSAEERAAYLAFLPDFVPEHLLVYFLYRYFLKAVVDRRLLARIRFAAFNVLCLMELGLGRFCRKRQLTIEDWTDLIHRYCREVEHSAENLERILSMLETESSLLSAWR